MTTGPRWLTTSTTVRAAEAAEGAEGPRAVEGIAVPYGVEWDAGGFREVFERGAFAADIQRWQQRQDGARLPFLSDHQARRFLGGVVDLEDTAEGVRFRAELRDTPDAAEYLAQVEAGANGVSVEFAPVGKPVSRNGLVRHTAARIAAIAGALTPAYDVARVAAREDHNPMTQQLTITGETPEPDPQPDPPTEPEAPQLDLVPQRRSAEQAAARAFAGPVARVTAPELVYGPTSDHRFMRDLLDAHRGDSAAIERQQRHFAQLDEVALLMARAGDVLSSEIPGAYPTEYLPGLLVPRILRGRPMASFFSRFAITDARPRTYGRVTTSTTAAAQASEGTNPAASDFATTAETVTPVLIGANILVSRQVLDGADPAAEAMLFEDMLEAYAQATETAVATAVEATGIAGSAVIGATPHAGMVDNVIAYQVARSQPAEGIFAAPTIYANALKQADTAGRLLIPWLGPQNAAGQQDAGAAGASVLGVPLALGWALTNGTAGVGASVITARRADMVIFESAVARFSYEQPSGPAAIKLGLWAYFAANDRRGVLESTTT